MMIPMPGLTTILLFALATFILTVSPGPGVLYVTARSLAQGRRAGFASMFGIEAGEVVWIAAAATGVAAVLAASVSALTFLRFAGAAYLIFLGIQRWRDAGASDTPEAAGLGRIFAQGWNRHRGRRVIRDERRGPLQAIHRKRGRSEADRPHRRRELRRAGPCGGCDRGQDALAGTPSGAVTAHFALPCEP
ncbi:MAG: LysE family translocator [Chloroflexi bacterium]|nr:MAG: LysE family translocator [Chloroflexota bacterium]